MKTIVKNRFYSVYGLYHQPGESVDVSDEEYQRLLKADAIYPAEIVETTMAEPAPENRAKRGRPRRGD